MDLIVTEKKFQEALEYQDLATDILCSRGYNVNCYCSKKWQYEKGESRNGIEIKNDTNIHSNKYKDKNGKPKPPRIYIETHEKQPGATDWVESGILRKDNTKYWFIGDKKRAWLFSKKQLRVLVDRPEFDRVTTKTSEGETSQGVCIPVEYLDNHPNIPLEVFDIEKLIQENENHIPGI